MVRAASIDIGTNTVRLLAAEVGKTGIRKEILSLRANTRLGEGLGGGGKLRPEARARTLAALSEFAQALRSRGIKEVSAVATEALRKATDADSFIREVFEGTGLRVEVISGEEEAKRTLAGVRTGLGKDPGDGEKLVLDIGGGSTEFIITRDWKKYTTRSLPVGAVVLYEKFIVGDPPAGSELSGLEAYSYARLGELDGFLPARPALVGTAGTITTLAAVDMAMDLYDPARITGHRISRERLDRLMTRLAGLTSEQRRLIAGLEAGREDIILSGAILLGAVMDKVFADSIMVCDYGLREGNLLVFTGAASR